MAVYIRVSTGKQVAEGHSLGAQADKLDAFARERGMEVVERISDEGESAKSLDRPGMKRLLELIQAGSIDAVFVTKSDRISRSLADFVKLSEKLAEVGVALITPDEPFDDSTPLGRAMLQMKGVFAELERGLIAERTKEMMAAAREKGIHLGRPPVGWTCVDGKLVPGERYDLVERAHEMKRDGARLVDIADAFNREGIPTGSGRGKWHPGNVGRLLKSPLAA